MFGLALPVAACASSAPAAAGSQALDPITFFIGRTHGDAKLHKLFAKTVQVEVDGVGRKQNGDLILDQTTKQGKQRPQSRRWVMQKVGPNHYSGTLTDAVGRVEILVDGSRASIRYKMRGNFVVRQHLSLQPDGRTILNNLSVTKYGIPVASLQEVIRKLG